VATKVRESPERLVHPIHPEDLFDRSTEIEGNWWAIYTMARQEKSLARDLHAAGLAYFLPLIKTTKVYRRSRVTRQVPFFPGYVFLFGSADDRVWSLSTNRVSRILPVTDPEDFRAELSQLDRLIKTGEPITAENQLSPGDRVRIKVGPLTGVEGVVIRSRSSMRLLVSVHFLQQGASIAVTEDMLEQVE
jgi:transcription antitermination factor NusG